MPHRLTRTAVVVLAALACGLGTAACGGGGTSKATLEAAQTRWQDGVPRWRKEMVEALDQISVLLSSPQTVDLLRHRDTRTTARLARLEQTLESCMTRVRRFGEAPGVLAPVLREAVRACRALDHGAHLVHDGVAKWQVGNRSADISLANVALGNGQSRIERVRAELKASLVSGNAST